MVGVSGVKKKTLRRSIKTKEEQSTETLLCQVTIGVTALAQQARRLKETKY